MKINNKFLNLEAISQDMAMEAVPTITTLQQTPMPSIHVLTIKVGCYKFIVTMNYGIQV
jgi:hypothetical protein